MMVMVVDGSDHADSGVYAKKKRSEEEDWRFDGRCLKPPKLHDGTDLTYFQPWLQMSKSEVMSKWAPWGEISKPLDEAGERRLDSNLAEISDMTLKSKSRR